MSRCSPGDRDCSNIVINLSHGWALRAGFRALLTPDITFRPTPWRGRLIKGSWNSPSNRKTECPHRWERPPERLLIAGGLRACRRAYFVSARLIFAINVLPTLGLQRPRSIKKFKTDPPRPQQANVPSKFLIPPSIVSGRFGDFTPLRGGGFVGDLRPSGFGPLMRSFYVGVSLMCKLVAYGVSRAS